MPRSRGRASTATALLVSPWRKAQRNRPQLPETPLAPSEARSTEEVLDSLDNEGVQALAAGLERFVRQLELPVEALCDVPSKGKDSWVRGTGILAFEYSGGSFVGMMLKEGSPRPLLHFTGYKRTTSFPDCRYNDAQELYELQIQSEQPSTHPKCLYIMNTGGDQARFETETEMDYPLKISFRCVELYGNTSEASLLSHFFEDPDVTVNIGVMWISEMNTC